MCGIFGFTGRPDAELLARLGDALRHRGPDDAGSFEGDRVSLGATRLALVGIRNGHQPFTSEDGRVVAVVNGEIYNHRFLRAGLEARGHRFATETDGEVLVHLYEETGADLVDALDGMFAFALHDGRDGRLLLGRDRLGMKPLFYARHAGRFLFASEMKALLLAAGLPRQLNLHALDGLLRLGFVPGEETLFQGVRRLPAGHVLSVGGDGAPERPARYWSVRIDTGGSPVERPAEALRVALERAVESHLQGDVPVAAALSGGLDSSVVVALMSRLLGPGVKTYSIASPGDQDERPFARRVADHCRTDHVEMETTPEKLLERLPAVLWHVEEPRNGPLVANDLLFERASRDVKALIEGEGADELFGGYLRFKTALPPLGWLPAGFAERIYGTRKIGQAAGRFYGPRLRELPVAPLGRAAFLGDALGRRGAARLAGLLAFEQAVQLPNAHLPRVDLLSMAHSLEVRLPYLDGSVVDLANRLPLREKVRWRGEKKVLRDVARDLLPAGIVRRPKQGQANPLRFWDRGGLLETASELLDPRGLAQRGLFEPRGVARLLSRVARGRPRPFDRNRLHLLVLIESWHRLWIDPTVLRSPVVTTRPESAV